MNNLPLLGIPNIKHSFDVNAKNFHKFVNVSPSKSMPSNIQIEIVDTSLMSGVMKQKKLRKFKVENGVSATNGWGSVERVDNRRLISTARGNGNFASVRLEPSYFEYAVVVSRIFFFHLLFCSRHSLKLGRIWGGFDVEYISIYLLGYIVRILMLWKIWILERVFFISHNIVIAIIIRGSELNGLCSLYVVMMCLTFRMK